MSLLIELDTTETSITVRFFSSHVGRLVETETKVPYGHGGGSFIVDYTRRVTGGAASLGTNSLPRSLRRIAGLGAPAGREQPRNMWFGEGVSDSGRAQHWC